MFPNLTIGQSKQANVTISRSDGIVSYHCTESYQALRRRVYWLSLPVLLVATTLLATLTYFQEQQQDALRDRVTFLADALHQAEVGVCVLQAADGACLEWSDGMQDLTGWTREDVLGRPITFLFPDSSKEEWQLAWDNARVAGQEPANIIRFRCWARCKDETLVPLSLSVQIMVVNGDASFVVLAQDDTKLRELPPVPRPVEVSRATSTN